MLAKSEVREIVTEAISTSGLPWGMGDIVLSVVASAIANAAFRLTGSGPERQVPKRERARLLVAGPLSPHRRRPRAT
jgi:hypothetical protein